MQVAEYISLHLHEQGVTHVYEVIGGMITRLADAVHRQNRIRLVDMHHEQAAAFAAEAGALLTGIPGVAMATSGPGATNLLTGIGSCYYDSVPAVFLTGQVNRNECKGDRPIRQLGFQETDIVAMARPIVKAAWRADDPERVPQMLQKAFAVAGSGRPGPVLLDIPMDVQGADIQPPPAEDPAVDTPPDPPDGVYAELLHSLSAARKPLILAGGGLRAARAVPAFRRMLDALRVPAVHSLLAVDVLPFDHPLRVGLIGTYGNRWANWAVGESDWLLVLGSRLDIRQTGALTDAFEAGRTIYHVDIDPAEINNRLKRCRPVIAHLRPFLERFADAASQQPRTERPEWISEIARRRSEQPDTREIDAPGINPNRLMRELSRASRQAAAVTVDVGSHQMWAAQSFEPGEDQRILTSGGMGSMGFALPAAVGACFAAGRPVLMIAGDGGMQINIQELETVRHHNLPLKMAVINNRSLGMVRQFQQSYFQGRYPGTVLGYSAPDFAKVAEAFGIGAASVGRPADLGKALQKLWADPDAPFLLQVSIDPSANVYPKIAFGRPMTDMEPDARPADLSRP